MLYSMFISSIYADSTPMLRRWYAYTSEMKIKDNLLCILPD